MATTLQWLDVSLRLHGETSQDHLMSVGLFTNCPTEIAKALQLLLPVFCIANSQSVPIFEAVPFPSG
jgi:hypothetical protein